MVLEHIGTVFIKIADAVNQKLMLFAAFTLAIMAIPTFADVLARYLMHQSVPGAIELAELMLVVVVFGCLGYINGRSDHIKVEIFLAHLPPRLATMLALFVDLFSLALFSVMAACIFNAAMHKLSGNDITLALSIPIHIFVFYSFICISAFAFSFIGRILTRVGRMLGAGEYAVLLAALALTALFIAAPWLIKGTLLAESKLLLGAVGMLCLLLLMFMGLPIGTAMTGIGFIGMLIIYPKANSAFSMLGISPYSTAANYVFSVVPMFIFMGELALASGISKDLFSAANTWLGDRPGGTAMASVAGCAGFSAVCGDSMATAVTMASVALPEMDEKKYDPGFSCAVLAAGGTLGILIPPSTGFIFYSLVTEVSIGKLFTAGIVPGILLALFFLGMVRYFAYRNPDLAPPGDKFTTSEKLRSLRGVIPMLLLILVILGGILYGAFSPNEGGAVGAVATFLYAIATRRLTWKGFTSAVMSTTLVTSKLLFILLGVTLLGYFFAATRLPFEIADLIVGMDANRYLILLGVVIFYIIMGCLMNVIPMILLTLPAIFPTIEALQFDPIWFGVVCVVLMEMGQITPPVGINVFALSSMAPGVPMQNIFRRIVPFFSAMVFLVLLLTLFPGLALWLPGIIF